MAEITAILVTYRSESTIRAALTPLKEAYDRGLLDCIVVENASGDATIQIVEDEFSWVTAIESSQNLGFGRGCNLGLERVVTPFVLFLNPDAIFEVAEIVKLLEFLRANPLAAIVAPSIREGDGSFQHVERLPTPWTVVSTALGLPWNTRAHREVVPEDEPVRGEWLAGAILLARTDVIRSVGGFDPRFFLYFEETDLCRRVSAAGHELWAVGGACASHVSGASAEATGDRVVGGCLADHFFQSRFYYLKKHFGWIAAILTEVAELVALLARSLGRAVRGRGPRPFRARIRAPLCSLPSRPAE